MPECVTWWLFQLDSSARLLDMTVFPSLNSTEANADEIELAKSTLEMNMTISRRQFFGALGASLAVANANLFADEPKFVRMHINEKESFALSDHLPQLAVFVGYLRN